MIGILNCGGDNADDFYASAHRSSLYKKIRRRSRTVSYGAGGRVFIDGQPLRKNTSQEMWDELLKLISTHNVLENVLRKPVLSASHTSRSDGELFTRLRNAIHQQESNGECTLEMPRNRIERSCAKECIQSCA